MVETTPPSDHQLKQTVSLQPAAAKDDVARPSVAFSLTVDRPRRGPCVLVLQAGHFETCTMPENIDQLWGPISLPTLPEGVPNTCIVASHRWMRLFYLSIYLPLFLQKARKSQCDNHTQRTGQDNNHNGTEHCPKYIKMTKKTISSDRMKSGQLVHQIKNGLKIEHVQQQQLETMVEL